jgi:hypothetical protein
LNNTGSVSTGSDPADVTNVNGGITWNAPSVRNLCGVINTNGTNLDVPVSTLTCNTIINTANGNLSFSGVLTGGSFDLTLNIGSGSATQSAGLVGVNTLTLGGAGGGYSLTQITNDVTTLTGNTGAVNYVDANDYTISGLTAASPSSVESRTGTLTVSGAVNVTGTLGVTIGTVGAGVLDVNAAMFASGGITATGGANADNFYLNVEPSGNYSINGAGGNDHLRASNVANNWNITSINGGTLNAGGTFTSIENLTGGTSSDLFTFADNMYVTGLVDGNTGGNNRVYFPAYTTDVVVVLGDATMGTVTLTGPAVTFNIINIQDPTPITVAAVELTKTDVTCPGGSDGTIQVNTISGGGISAALGYEVSITGPTGMFVAVNNTPGMNQHYAINLPGSIGGTTYSVWVRMADQPFVNRLHVGDVVIFEPTAYGATITPVNTHTCPPAAVPTGMILISNPTGGPFTVGPYEYAVALAGTPFGSLTFSTTANYYSLGVYNAATNYDVWIRKAGICPVLLNTVTISPDPNAPYFTSTVTITSITSSSARAEWAAIPGIPMYSLRYRIVGSPTWTTVGPFSTPYFNMFGLQNGTQYEVQVAASAGVNCNGQWSGSTLFSTVAGTTSTGCSVPSGVFVTATTLANTVVQWNAVSGAVCYLVSYGLSGTSPSTWTEVSVPAPTTSFTMPVLPANKTYRVQVRTNCSTCINPKTTGVRSAYSTAVSWVTPASREESGDISVSASGSTLTVYPNPSQGRFTVQYSGVVSGEVTLRLVDMAGRALYNSTHAVNSGETSIPVEVSGYTAGLYLLEVVLPNGERQHTKIMLK